MYPIPFSEIDDFREADFNGINVLFTELRIERDTLPEGVYAYDIRGGEDSDFSTIESLVTVDHTGTIITRQPIPLEPDGFIEIDEFGLMDELTYEQWNAA